MKLLMLIMLQKFKVENICYIKKKLIIKFMCGFK